MTKIDMYIRSNIITEWDKNTFVVDEHIMALMQDVHPDKEDLDAIAAWINSIHCIDDNPAMPESMVSCQIDIVETLQRIQRGLNLHGSCITSETFKNTGFYRGFVYQKTRCMRTGKMVWRVWALMKASSAKWGNLTAWKLESIGKIRAIEDIEIIIDQWYQGKVLALYDDQNIEIVWPFTGRKVTYKWEGKGKHAALKFRQIVRNLQRSKRCMSFREKVYNTGLHYGRYAPRTIRKIVERKPKDIL